MKKTIKILALALAVLAAISCFAGCGKKKSDKLVVGITEFEPMDYKDKDGKRSNLWLSIGITRSPS